MSEPQPIDRLNYTGSLVPVIDRLCQSYGIGNPIGHTVIATGYEDCNVIIETEQDKFMAKMFAKTRKPVEISRYVTTIQNILAAGVHHPELVLAPSNESIYTDKGIALVLLRFVEGKTFLELNRTPDDSEQAAVLEQAARVNKIDYCPPYIFDSWAVPNIKTMYNKVKALIEPEELRLAEQAIAQYNSIPINELPHCFVHGDMTKANVVKAEDGGVYVLDFSVANWYPRIQELAVIIANLLHDKESSLDDLVEKVSVQYSTFNQLTTAEKNHLKAYTISAIAMEFMGGLQEKHINGHNHEETDYWIRLGYEGLSKALNQ